MLALPSNYDVIETLRRDVESSQISNGLLFVLETMLRIISHLQLLADPRVSAHPTWLNFFHFMQFLGKIEKNNCRSSRKRRGSRVEQPRVISTGG